MHTAHSAIIFLMNKPITNGRVTRWLLLLQEFNIIFIDQLGRENLVANFVSLIQHDDSAKPIDDTFPEEHLFVLFVQTPWFADIANYLATGKLPNHLSPHEKCRVIIHISNYSWVDNEIFRTVLDLIIIRCIQEDEMTEIESMQAMMAHVVGTFLISEQHTKCCIPGITGQAFLRMFPGMLKDVTVAKERVY